MPVPTTIADLDPVAANNYPTGSESVGPNLDDYLRAHAAILKQVSNSIAPAIAATIPAGVILMWSGSVASIPAGWKLCDGTLGTPDLRSRFVVGAGSSYAPGATGGADTVTLNANQMPVHAHGVSDPGHAHSVYDPGHNHGVNDPGHTHSVPTSPGTGGSPGPARGSGIDSSVGTGGSVTGIWLNASGTGIGIYGAATNISIQNAGSGQAHENRPPYYALAFIQKT
jgi:microcystin-dependent protein